MLRKNVLGLDIAPTSSNAKKLAQDLVSLQSLLYHMTSPVDFLDQHPDKGHTNYELNRLGLVLAQRIKDEIRSNPTKSVIDFYVTLLDECWKLKNYEIGARVYQGINDAINRDEVILPPGVFDMPAEDKGIKAVRDEIKNHLSKIKKWDQLRDKHFPTAPASKNLYVEHLREGCPFVPSIQAFMNFIAIRLDNAKSILIDEGVSPGDKYTRLLEIKAEILSELLFMEDIILRGLPVPRDKNFESLHTEFKDCLRLKLRPVSGSCDDVLDRMLKLKELKADHASSFVASKSRLFQESPNSRKNTTKYPRAADVFQENDLERRSKTEPGTPKTTKPTFGK